MHEKAHGAVFSASWATGSVITRHRHTNVADSAEEHTYYTVSRHVF